MLVETFAKCDFLIKLILLNWPQKLCISIKGAAATKWGENQAHHDTFAASSSSSPFFACTSYRINGKWSWLNAANDLCSTNTRRRRLRMDGAALSLNHHLFLGRIHGGGKLLPIGPIDWHNYTFRAPLRPPPPLLPSLPSLHLRVCVWVTGNSNSIGIILIPGKHRTKKVEEERLN